MPTTKLHLFGSPYIEHDDVCISFGSRKVSALVYYLAIAESPVGRDSIVALLWPDSDQPGGRGLLRDSLYRVRKETSDRLLVANRDTVSLNPDADVWIDVSRFNKIIKRCKSHSHLPEHPCTECSELLKEATQLYCGGFLDGFTVKGCADFDNWQMSQAQSLLNNLTYACQILVKWYKYAGQLQEAIDYCQRWILVDGLDETAHRELMDLYALSNRRGAALKQYENCRQILLEELGAAPARATVELYKSIKHGENDLAGIERHTAKPFNPPRQLSEFIGRKRELAEIKQLARNGRLVTLSGVGGCGKTRLALQAASEMLNEFAYGALFVDLTAVSNATAVPGKLASAVGVIAHASTNTASAIIVSLKSKQLLLILDNCEHLIHPCAEIVENLLSECNGLTILVTSREPLTAEGEIVWRVPSLSKPDIIQKDELSLSDLDQFESAQLFINRLRASTSNFVLTEDHTSPLANLCARLDGIPLAIELAAARARAIPLQEMCRRLDDRFLLLSSNRRTAVPRHQTLRTAIDWSYDLLNTKEMILFRRLSVFVGGFALDSIESVCTGAGEGGALVECHEMMPIINSLVDKSLVLLDGERYKMLDMIQQYSGEKLQAAGEHSALRRSHRDWILALSERAEPETKGHNQDRWFSRLDAELENIRAALVWTRDNGEIAEGVRIIWALVWFLFARGHFSEGLSIIEGLLQDATNLDLPTWARAETAAGMLTFYTHRRPSMPGYGSTSFTLNMMVGDAVNLSWLLYDMAMRQYRPEHYHQTVGLLDESVRVAGKIGAVAVAQANEALGIVHLVHDEFSKSQRSLIAAIRTCRDMGLSSAAKLPALVNLIGISVERKDWEEAARFYGALNAHDEQIRLYWRVPFEEWLSRLLGELAEDELKRCKSEGERMDTGDIIERSLKQFPKGGP